MLKQFIRFGIVGVINTSLDFVIYAFLTRLFLFFDEHYLIANLISFSIATVNSYIFNKYWTFKDNSKQHKIQYTKFYLVSLCGLILTQTILYILVELGLYDLLAKAIAVGVVLFWNFFVNKFWTFKKTKNLV